MNKQELIAKAKAGRVTFNGNVEVGRIWDGDGWQPYYVQYADKDGIHACPDGLSYCVDDFEPYDFDEICDKDYEDLIQDISE